ncbi:MAG: YraN family protein [Hyphomicrobiales bacterium]|nr:YraN family protein [Hyphomicrobiales bacterium]MCC2108814.1 YraN family protein [Hyphomicrobiales bacterium]
MSGHDRNAALAFGLNAETIAALWLRLKFYKILERRYRIREGEIDIIAARGATIAFVEVKARPSMDEAVISISAQKRRRMSRAAHHWLATHPWAVNRILRGDALFIAPHRLPRHVPAAVELDLG